MFNLNFGPLHDFFQERMQSYYSMSQMYAAKLSSTPFSVKYRIRDYRRDPLYSGIPHPSYEAPL